MSDRLSFISDFSQPELDQVLGLELASRPAIALLELNSEEVFHLVALAILHGRLALVVGKLKGDGRARRNQLLDFETCAGR